MNELIFIILFSTFSITQALSKGNFVFSFFFNKRLIGQYPE